MGIHERHGRAPAVRASEMGHRYGARPVLHDLSFSLHPGVTGLVGVNGAGKSTLMRLLRTSVRTSTGVLGHFGSDATRNYSEVRRRIGYMPQSLELPRNLQARDFLAYMAWLRAVPRRVRPDLIRMPYRVTSEW